MDREEIGLLAACYVVQYIAEGSAIRKFVPKIWRKVGKAAEFCRFPEAAARMYFRRWQQRGWLDESYSNPNLCELTEAGHMVAKSVLFFRR